MAIKSAIKRVIGQKNVEHVRAGKAILKYLQSIRPGNPKHISLLNSEWQEPMIFCQPGRHVFFGYYDLQQLNQAEDKMLVTVLSKRADTEKDMAEIGWYSLNDGQYHPLTMTSAWCWQQGARLRWHPTVVDTILYNDVDGTQYVTRMCNLATGRIERLASRACYDITPDMKYGLSLNFSRLQRLRPGYGYNKLPDQTIKERVPKEDGIFLVDMENDTSKLIISYEQLSRLSPGSEREWNYVNHISIAPDGNRFMFFHLWTPGIGERWQAKLYIADLDGGNIRCLEEEFVTSHYCWKNNNELLTTTVALDGNCSHYFVYDVNSGKRTGIQGRHLQYDGHPSCFGDGDQFISDTYPLKNCMQHLFISAINKDSYKPICDLFSDPRMYGEKRCDLHPRLTPDNKILTVDSTFQNGTRSVVLFHKIVQS